VVTILCKCQKTGAILSVFYILSKLREILLFLFNFFVDKRFVAGYNQDGGEAYGNV
jgi:hypothetical protein